MRVGSTPACDSCSRPTHRCRCRAVARRVTMTDAATPLRAANAAAVTMTRGLQAATVEQQPTINDRPSIDDLDSPTDDAARTKRRQQPLPQIVTSPYLGARTRLKRH